MTGTRIGYVEDDPVIRDNYTELLRDEGYEVQSHESREDALADFRERCPDLVLVDVALGQERDGGYQLCTQLRVLFPALPIVFLTSHDGDIDKISGLRLGADDYLSKDTSPPYLLARIETLLRRMAALQSINAEPPSAHRTLGDLELDLHLSRVTWKGSPIDLSLTQFWILAELTSSPEVRSADDLMRAAKLVVEPNTIAAHIKSIRKRFHESDPEFSQIKTERGLGYRWLVTG